MNGPAAVAALLQHVQGSAQSVSAADFVALHPALQLTVAQQHRLQQSDARTLGTFLLHAINGICSPSTQLAHSVASAPFALAQKPHASTSVSTGGTGSVAQQHQRSASDAHSAPAVPSTAGLLPTLQAANGTNASLQAVQRAAALTGALQMLVATLCGQRRLLVSSGVLAPALELLRNTEAITEAQKVAVNASIARNQAMADSARASALECATSDRNTSLVAGAKALLQAESEDFRALAASTALRKCVLTD